MGAHKLVLSASSEYFKSFFKNNSNSNPFLCLDGVSSIDLNNILDYIYYGEIQINQEHLDRFLSTAKRFMIEGLFETEENEEKKSEMSSTLDPPKLKVKPEKDMPVKSEILTDNTYVQQNNKSPSLDTNDLNNIDERLFENMEKNYDGVYACKICNRTNKSKYSMKVHIETHMEGISFPCNVCGKDFKTRNTFKSHFSKKNCK